MVKFLSFFDFDNDGNGRRKCLYVPRRSAIGRQRGVREHDGCKSGDSLGNLANGCAVGRNGSTPQRDTRRGTGMPDGDEMIAIDKFEGLAPANNPLRLRGVWTENGATNQPTSFALRAQHRQWLRQFALHGPPGAGLCHPDGASPGPNALLQMRHQN